MLRHTGIVLCCLLLISCQSMSQSVSQTTQQNDQWQQAGIATAHPLATQAGYDVIQQGGNAFDAAVAVAAALAVVEPYSSGIGGGGFFLLHRADDQLQTMIDARETAPLSATTDMYLDAQGEVMKTSREGPLAAGIPGLPAGLVHIAEHYGQLPLATSLQPAIEYARQGFAVTEHYQKMTGWRLKLLQQDGEARQIFLAQGELPDVGYLIKQPDLANTLQALADQGHPGFYQGPVASQLVDGVRRAGGIWQMKDLADYKVEERTPVSGSYRGMQITSAAPPSAGGIGLMTALNILSQYPLTEVDEVTSTHLTVEAMRRIYRDRAQYLGDPDFVDIPAHLTSPLYAMGLVAGIRGDQATVSASLPGVSGQRKGQDTTHFSIIDAAGNRVAATLSINFPYGSGFVPPGTGVVLNNEMDDFSAKSGVPNGYGLVMGTAANAIEPGKRMLSSMTPTFLETSDRIAVIGTPGGSRIITMVLLGALEFHKGTSAAGIVSLPRIHHQFLPDRIAYEPDALTTTEIEALSQLGHQLKAMNRRYGNMQVVIVNKQTGLMDAAADPRGEGTGKVWFSAP